MQPPKNFPENSRAPEPISALLNSSDVASVAYLTKVAQHTELCHTVPMPEKKEPDLLRCPYRLCGAWFMPKRNSQLFCCTAHAHRENAYRWADRNPEKARVASTKRHAKNYLAGDLPNWMYT